MGDVKPWQVILIVAAVLALGFSVWKFGFSGRVEQPDQILLVDVVSGQLFDARKGSAKGFLIPAKHPVTGDRTLFPVEETEEGVWQLGQRYIGAFHDRKIPVTVVEGDYSVRVLSEEVQVYVPTMQN